jgi:hypothetical protein
MTNLNDYPFPDSHLTTKEIEDFQKAFNSIDPTPVTGVVGIRTRQAIRSVDCCRFPPSRPGDGQVALILA